MKKQYLAIFDMDGTLFDTREINFCSYRDALSEYGIELDHEEFMNRWFGRHYKEFLPVIMGGTENMEAVHNNKKARYAENLDKARENLHLFHYIEAIQNSYYTAVVTTASKENVVEILNYFGRKELFELILTQEDFTKTKPDPEGFLMAMKHFQIDAAHTVIFEDSEVGVEAARRSGASVLAVNKF